MDAVDTKDREWLRGQLIELFEQARKQVPIDHAVCSKYADLLLKTMAGTPVASDRPISDNLRRLLNGSAPTTGDRDELL